MTVARIKAKLKAGKPSIGSWMQLPSEDVAEIMGQAGYDWIAVDLEHGLFSRPQLAGIVRALELGGTTPLVRLPDMGAHHIKEAMESGVRGLIFPLVEDPEQLRQAIGASLYPPAGTRGVGFSRANLYGKHFDAYRRLRADDVLFVAMVESRCGMERLEDILRVEHVSAVLVGPYDLSASLGLTGDFRHPRFRAALERVRGLCAARSCPLGIHVPQPDRRALARRIAEGYRFLAYGTDAVFLHSQAQCPPATTRRSRS